MIYEIIFDKMWIKLRLKRVNKEEFTKEEKNYFEPQISTFFVYSANPYSWARLHEKLQDFRLR